MLEDKILITNKDNRRVLYAIQNGRLEYMLSTLKSSVGEIYVGHVENIVQNIHAAFVRYDGPVTGYLPLESVHPRAVIGREIRRPEDLRRGDLVLVQIDAEAIKTKQPHLTMKLSLAGQYTVAILGRRSLGCSKKLPEEKRKALIKGVQKANLPVPDLPIDILIRTEAGGADVCSSMIEDEIQTLSSKMQRIIEKGRSRKVGSLLYTREENQILCNEVIQLLHFLQKENIVPIEIITEDSGIYEELSQIELLTKNQTVTMRLHDAVSQGELSLLYGLQGQCKELHQRKVWLKSGAYLVIEQTEAMNVIDVNTGKSIHGSAAAFKEINLEAATECLRQIRLRGFTGMILIDFINMKGDEEAYKEMEEVLKRECARDPVHTKFIDFTGLGIAELTRSKTG